MFPQELLENYLNGPRTLSNDRLSYLMVSQPNKSMLPSPPLTPDPQAGAAPGGENNVRFDLMICAVHFLGDGMALHQFANDLFTLLGSANSQVELEQLLSEEHRLCVARSVDDVS